MVRVTRNEPDNKDEDTATRKSPADTRSEQATGTRKDGNDASDSRDDEYVIPPFGSAEHPYGKTNHAMTADDIAEAALREGTLRPDGRPKQSVFYDDVLLKQEQERRDFVEKQQWDEKGNVLPQNVGHDPVAERAEPVTAEVALTSSADLEAVKAARSGDDNQSIGSTSTDEKNVKK